MDACTYILIVVIVLTVAFGVAYVRKVREADKRQTKLMQRYFSMHPDATRDDVMELFDVPIEQVLKEVWGLTEDEVRELLRGVDKEMQRHPELTDPREYFAYADEVLTKLLWQLLTKRRGED